MRPDDPDYEGAFKIEDYIAGVQYAFGEPTFDRMVYAEFAYGEGRLADGERPRNRFTVGVRWGWSG